MSTYFRQQHLGHINMPNFASELAAVGLAVISVSAVLTDAPEDDRVAAYCMAGSVLGSFGYILWTKAYERDRGVVLAFLSNAIFAYLFSPFLTADVVMRFFDVRPTYRACLFVSGTLSIFAPYFVEEFGPMIKDKLKRVIAGLKLSSLLGLMGYSRGLPDDTPHGRDSDA